MLSQRLLLIISVPFALLLLPVEACTTTTSDTGTNELTIADILKSPAEFDGKSVTLDGKYQAWQAENGYGPPVTRSDWIMKDDSGWIYVTGKSPGLDPAAGIGTPVEVIGTVRVTSKGIPYIEAKSAQVGKQGAK